MPMPDGKLSRLFPVRFDRLGRPAIDNYQCRAEAEGALSRSAGLPPQASVRVSVIVRKIRLAGPYSTELLEYMMISTLSWRTRTLV